MKRNELSPDSALPDPSVYPSRVRRILLLTLVLNLFVVVLKAIVGWATGSLSVAADAVHSLTDSANNVLGLLVLKMASAPPDAEHPYGHQKFEAVGALAIAAMLAIACFEVLRGAASRLMEGALQVPQMGRIEWVLMVAVLVVNVVVAVYERVQGRRLGSPILVADAEHTLGDIWITVGVILGLIGSQVFGWAWLDVALSLPVAAMVLFSGWRVLRSNLPWLVDARAVPAEQIAVLVTPMPDVLGCHAITSRGMPGQLIHIELHVVTSRPGLREAYALSEQVRQVLEAQFAPARVTVHIEPPSTVQ